VIKYILTRDEHHKEKLFKEEYFEMLAKNNVEFNQEYLFDFFCDIKEWN
jgi:putative transposase